jgi:S1-C subfamily serine protease
MLSRLIQCILSYFFIILKTSCSTSDLIYEETFQSTTKSLGLKLSQELQILGFAPRSPAQARGVKTGDILIKVNEEDLEAQGPKGL